jgi:hypothetical protein
MDSFVFFSSFFAPFVHEALHNCCDETTLAEPHLLSVLEEILPSRLYYYKIKLRHKIIHGLEGFENVKNKLVISTVLRWKDSNLTLYFNFK